MSRPRPTPEQIMDREMEKLAAMGITISVTPSQANGFEERPSGIIAAAARRHGIYHDRDTNHRTNPYRPGQETL